MVVGTPQSLEAYGCMMRKDDPHSRPWWTAPSPGSCRAARRRIYAKWFESPIPPKGLNLNFPLSAEMTELYANPNDKALQ